MKYEEIEDWKKLAKEEKYEEATKSLLYEMGMNLMRVHNLYSDVKYDEKEKWYISIGSSLFLKDCPIIYEQFESLVRELELIDIKINESKDDIIIKYAYDKALASRKKAKRIISKLKL